MMFFFVKINLNFMIIFFKQFKEIENSSEDTNTLNILINLYNSELEYLNLLKKAFEVYAEPLR